MKSVGIPRGLFYFYYYPWWKTFFTELGIRVMVSEPTNRRLAEWGLQLALDESCFPIKVYLGHIHSLCQKGADYILVPRLVSVEPKSFICPKFIGLPDMVRALLPETPPLIDVTVDLSRNRRNMRQEILALGRLFTDNRRQIERAWRQGQEEWRFYRALLAQGCMPEEALRCWEGEALPPLSTNQSLLNLAVLGHGYTVYDELISMGLLEKLRDRGCRVWLPEHLKAAVVETAATAVPKRVFWTLGRKLLGSALHWSQEAHIDGIIYLACFGCGPDSLVGEIIERRLRAKKPFLMLTVDEHTGEAGMVTRLEAFCDMLERRKEQNSESYFSSHGSSGYSFEGSL